MCKSLYTIFLQQDGGNRIKSRFFVVLPVQKRFVIVSGARRPPYLDMNDVMNKNKNLQRLKAKSTGFEGLVRRIDSIKMPVPPISQS